MATKIKKEKPKLEEKKVEVLTNAKTEARKRKQEVFKQ